MDRWRWIGRTAINFIDRLRKERLDKAKAELKKSEMGALLVFDMNNVRYLTATTIGTWAQDKISRFALLCEGEELSRAGDVGFRLGGQAPSAEFAGGWGSGRAPGLSMLRGAMSTGNGPGGERREEDQNRARDAGAAQAAARHRRGGFRRCCSRGRSEVHHGGRDRQQLMSAARVIKTEDEISLLNHSAMMVDAAYDELYRAMKPGMSENQAVGLASKVLYDLGSEYVEAINAISGERCNPHPSLRLLRIACCGRAIRCTTTFCIPDMGYRTCYYRCFAIGFGSHALVDAYKRCRDYLDAAIALVRPGRQTREIAEGVAESAGSSVSRMR